VIDMDVHESIKLKFVTVTWGLEVDTRLNMLSIAESAERIVTGAASSRSVFGPILPPIQWTQGTLCCRRSGRNVKLITCLRLMTIIRLCVSDIQ
jgi:hypothetical protein